MKQPYEISSDFFKKMTSSGWYFERDVLLEKLPPHLEELPDLVKKFLREIWYISVAKDMYIPVEYEMFMFDNEVYTFWGNNPRINRLLIRGKQLGLLLPTSH